MPLPAAAYCEIDFPLPGRDERLRAAFAAPIAVLAATTPADVPALLAVVEAHARQGRWALGYVAYEAAGSFDAALRTRPGAAGLPCAQFAIYAQPAPQARRRSGFLCGAWRDALTRAEFDATLAGIRDDIVEGRYYQLNYTTRLAAPFLGDGLALHDALRASQPDAHCAYLDFGRWRLCSASPELFFHWGAENAQDRVLSSRPMKGTAARAADPDEDRAAAERLRRSPKECAENLMIVDLIRNDLARVARLGSVGVPALFTLEAWPTVWQMTSTVACRTRAGVGLAEVFGALFPCGSVTGAPKAAAMAAIAAREAWPRGAYCGAIGVVMPGGEALFDVGIRSVVVDAERGVAECGIGSGITLDSTAGDEWAEWRAKRAFLERACPEYRLLETLRLHRGRYWLRRGHLRRLARSAAALGYACDATRIEAALAAAAAHHPVDDWRARLLLAADGEPTIEVLPLDPTPRAPTVALAAAAVDSGDPRLRHKTTQRGLYDSLAVSAPGIFDSLLHNERGEATEFTRGNLVVDLRGRLLTPPLTSGLLPGVYREALLARRRIREQVLTLDDLRRADALWFVNSLRGAVAVTLA